MALNTVPGATVATTLQLPMPATNTVKWTVVDPLNNIIADGQQPPTGALVLVSFVMPSNVVTSPDGSDFTITATDGLTSTSTSLSVQSKIDPSYRHSGDVAYVKGMPFEDVLITENTVTSASLQMTNLDGTLIANHTLTNPELTPSRIGDAYAIKYVSPGLVDTNTSATWGTGTLTWSYVMDGADPTTQVDIHPFYTITPYSSTFLAAIRNLVDRARAGDANRYLNITTADLAKSLLRGFDYVIQSPPYVTPFSLDQAPIMLRDYIIKAAALDLLRAQYLAEGMSAFDFEGEGVQLNVDRSQYLASLAEQLSGDLQGLQAAKKSWMAAGSPMGSTLAAPGRPLGVLGLSIQPGLRNIPVPPSFYGGLQGNQLGFNYSFQNSLNYGIPILFR